MQAAGSAKKVSIYLSEGSTHHGNDAAAQILDFLFYRGVAGATMLKGIAGFGADHHLHSSSLLAVSDRLPIKVEFIDTPERVNELLPKLLEMAGSGTIDVQDTTIVKASQQESRAPAAPTRRMQGSAKLLRIYVNENDTWNDKPLHEALVEALRANDIAGVTVYKAILGYGEQRTLHEPKMLADDASLMLSVIDSKEHLNALLPVLEKMVNNGLAVISDVDVVTYRYGSDAAAHEGV